MTVPIGRFTGWPETIASRRRNHHTARADLIGQPWETGMTWNSGVLESVSEFLAGLG